MPSFEIPDAPASVKLTPGEAGKPSTGTAQFTVNSRSDSTMNAQLSLGVQGDAKPEWFAIEGDAERRIEASKSETVNINISVAPGTAPGHYPFRLRVAAVNDPDNDFVDGPTTLAEIPASVVVTPVPFWKKWWFWLIVGLLLLGVIGGIVAAVMGGKEKKTDDPLPTETATTEPVSDLLTVPDLKGKNRAQLRRLAAGFELVETPGQVQGQAPGTIIDQNPLFGAPDQPKNTLLRVTYDPGRTVGVYEGQTLVAAIQQIGRDGLDLGTVETRCQTSGTPDAVLDQTPDRSSTVAGGSKVNLVVRRVALRCSVVSGTMSKDQVVQKVGSAGLSQPDLQRARAVVN